MLQSLGHLCGAQGVRHLQWCASVEAVHSRLHIKMRLCIGIASQVLLTSFGHCSGAGPDKRFGVDNVGTGPAGLTSYLALLTFKPDLLITSGTAGGFKAQGAAIADVFLGTKFINHDRRNPIPVCALLCSSLDGCSGVEPERHCTRTGCHKAVAAPPSCT